VVVRKHALLFTHEIVYTLYHPVTYSSLSRKIPQQHWKQHSTVHVLFLQLSIDELKTVITKERQRYQHKEQTRKIKIEQLTAMAALETMQPATKSQAIQNRVMEKVCLHHSFRVLETERKCNILTKFRKSKCIGLKLRG
jgi:hypothetical protein